MGKRIIQQRRGHGSNVYRVKNSASQYRPGYPVGMSGEWEVVKLISSQGHSAPLAKLRNKEGKVWYNFAAEMLYVGQKIMVGGKNKGDITTLGSLENGTEVFNIENMPNDSGKLVRTSGNRAYIMANSNGVVKVMMPSKQEKDFSAQCRVTVGRIAGEGRLSKPILKAGKQFFIKKTKSKLWPRTSAIKMNRIDHPFGSGRGKRIKSKIAKRNSPPGKKVGLLRPRRTGRRKR